MIFYRQISVDLFDFRIHSSGTGYEFYVTSGTAGSTIVAKQIRKGLENVGREGKYVMCRIKY